MRPEFPSVPISCLLLLAALAAPDVEAQAPAPAQAEPAPTVEPDISLTATVRARSVEFHSPPRVDVDLTGTPGRHEVDRTWRDNLPEEILPGRTYRDIGVRFEASTTLDPAAVDPFRIDADVDPLQPQDEATP